MECQLGLWYLVYGMTEDCLGWPCLSLYQETVIPTSGCWLLGFPFSTFCEGQWCLLCLCLCSAAGVRVWWVRVCLGELCRANGSGICLACDPLVRVCGQDCMYTPAPEPGSRRPQSADVWACPQPSGAITEVCLPRGSDYENYLKHASGVTMLCFFTTERPQV